MYNDGKVCISLLGTAHAWNATQQWNKDSSLAQVLMSIQTQILGVDDPFFSEGFGHANTKGTRAGEEASKRYNNTVRLATLRHAIIDHLKFPKRGFEEVTLRHFSVCRKRLLVQARRWLVEARATPIQHRFERAYNTLVSLLASDQMKKFHDFHGTVLAPLSDDVEFLWKTDEEFARTHLSEYSVGTRLVKASRDELEDPFGTADERKPSAVAIDANLVQAVAEVLVTRSHILEKTNPWAKGGARLALSHDDQSPPAKKDCDTDEDDSIYD